MNFLKRFSLLIVIVLASVPLVIMAQDNGQPIVPTLTENEAVPPYNPTLTENEAVPPYNPTLTENEAVPPYNPTLTENEAVPPYNPTLTENEAVPPYNPTLTEDEAVPPFVPTLTRPSPTTQPTTKITNGQWVLDPNGSTYSKSGDCKVPGGDNDGPDGNGTDLEDLPRVPVCMTTDQQWITVDSGGAYPLVVPNTYSLQEMSREILETNGKSSGTINVNITRQYQVINSGEIVMSYIRHEDGGCTTNSSVTYRLIQADESVCHVAMAATPNYTAVPTTIPTAQPGETQVPPVTPEPPIQIGEYTIQLPPVDATCSAQQMPPSSNLNVSYDNNQNMFINFGGGSYTLYWNGSDYYEFHDGNQFMISMNTYPGGASLLWSKQGCFVSSNLSGAGLPATATPEEVEPTSVPTLDVASSAGSSYTVKTDIPVYLCAADNKSMLPDLSGAVLKAQADNTMTFSVGGKDYVLTSASGILTYAQSNDDGSLLTISMNGFTDGIGSGMYAVFSADGSKSCIAQLTFTPK